MSIDRSATQLPNAGQPLPGLITAGQPSADQFQALAKSGLKHVVNLRPATEDAGFDEAALARQLGLRYTLIPISGAGDLDMRRVQELHEALRVSEKEEVLVHCASSNRVGALLALRAKWIQGLDTAEALAIGRAGGLTKLEPMVSGLLEHGPG